jgi:hypothetical protein
MVGGYDFKWRISHLGVQDDEVFMESEIDYGGKVTLIGDGRTINFDDASKNEDLWWEIDSEIKSVIEDILYQEVTKKTGIMVDTNLCWIKE